MDRSEQLISDTLSEHATDAPSDDRLLAAVHARLRRRRTSRTVGAVVLAAAAVATAITASHGFTTQPQTAQQPQAPGWRWESFGTVQVQVPSRWTQYVSGPAPCTTFANSAVPTIGRVNGWPASREYTCKTAVVPLAERQPYLWFNDVQAPGIKRYDGSWTEETRVVGGVKLSVLTKDDTLRRRILDSARTITDTDYYGCSAQQPDLKPTAGPNVNVTSASVCEYWHHSLIAGSNVPASRVDELSGRIPDPEWPRDPGMIPAGCQDPAARTYVIVLRSADRTWRIPFSYTTCTPLRPRILDLLQYGPHHQIQPADIFDPVGRVTPLVR